MEYRQIISVTGLSGLFQILSTKNDGAIVKSLTDDSVKYVSSRIHQITPLESIEIYTYEGNVRLHEVFEKIKENDEPITALNSKKDNQAAKDFFKSVLPQFDEDRVYASDIRKILKWYASLKERDLLNFDYLNEEMNSADDSEAKAQVKSEKDIPEDKSNKIQNPKGIKEEKEQPDKAIKKKTVVKVKEESKAEKSKAKRKESLDKEG